MARVIVALVLSCVILSGCESDRQAIDEPDLAAGQALHQEWKRLGEREGKWTATQIFNFTLVAIPAGMEKLRRECDELTPEYELMFMSMAGGDWFEDWGCKLQAEGRRLTARTLIKYVEHQKAPSDWRMALRGYIQHIVFKNQRDGRQIGLTDEDLRVLRDYCNEHPIPGTRRGAPAF